MSEETVNRATFDLTTDALVNARKAMNLLFNLVMDQQATVTDLEEEMRKDGRFDYIKSEVMKAQDRIYKFNPDEPTVVPKLPELDKESTEPRDISYDPKVFDHISEKYELEIENLINKLETSDLSYRPEAKLAVIVACALFGYKPHFSGHQPVTSAYTGFKGRCSHEGSSVTSVPADHEMDLFGGND